MVLRFSRLFDFDHGGLIKNLTITLDMDLLDKLQDFKNFKDLKMKEQAEDISWLQEYEQYEKFREDQKIKVKAETHNDLKKARDGTVEGLKTKEWKTRKRDEVITLTVDNTFLWKKWGVQEDDLFQTPRGRAWVRGFTLHLDSSKQTMDYTLWFELEAEPNVVSYWQGLDRKEDFVKMEMKFINPNQN